MRNVVLTTALLLAAAAVSLAAGEIALRMLTRFPITETSNMRSHPLLLYTADPALPDIDAHGFRNPEPVQAGDRIASYDVVAIGDSHTYGVNADHASSWPAQLSTSSGLSVYNLGIGGYSIYQYDVLMDMALALRPRHIVVAVYVANDWVPDCLLFALPEWQARIERLGISPPCDAGAPAGQTPAGRHLSLRSVIEATALGSAVHTLIWLPLRYRSLQRGATPGRAGSDLVRYQVGGHTFTFAMPRLNRQSRATDLSAPHIAAAYADGLRLLARWRDAASEHDILLSVALLPSKQRVLREWALTAGHALPPAIENVTVNEVTAAAQLLIDLERLGISFVDATPVVIDAFDATLRSGVAMYPPGWDGHPYAIGYAAYARAIGTLLDRDPDHGTPRVRPAAEH